MNRVYYITGSTALNIPDDLNQLGDWHFSEVITASFDRLHISGRNIQSTQEYLGDYGIRDGTELLKNYGFSFEEGTQVFVANHVRAVLDLVFNSVFKNRYPGHITVNDILSEESIDELRLIIDEISDKINNTTQQILLNVWKNNNT